MTINLRNIVFLFLVCLSFRAQATHNRAGDITYVQIGPLKIRAIVTTYTKTSSAGADRDSVRVYWGDGQDEWISRVNGPAKKGEPLENDIKRNFYIAEHTYPGSGSYTINMTDPNRVGNVLNLNFPNSINVQFHLATTLTLLNSTIQGYNNSVVLLQPPIDFGCIGKKFVHNLNAYDPDGDSLSFELIVPLQATNSEVPNYRFPDQITPGADNKISLDKSTGNFVWLSPQKDGEYNIAILIKEYRNGVLLNSVIRDMQITIENCSNDPPELKVPNDICVIAGQKIEFMVSAIDKNTRDKIAITALGGPFNQIINKSVFNVTKGYQSQPATGTFIWQTSCEHISEVAYTVVFRAVDNFKDTTGIADLKSVKIKVVGPPPQNVSAVGISSSQSKITWTFPSACSVTVNDYFKGFSVWRKINSNKFPIDSCKTGLEGRGYVKIASNINTKNGAIYYYDDDMLDGGNTYCYRILAEFAFTSPGGNAYNRVVGLPSEESCIQLKRDLPFITQASVIATSTSTGAVSIKWIMPLSDDLDTIKNKGPYKIVLLGAEGISPLASAFIPLPGASYSSLYYSTFSDSIYSQNVLNTSEKQYSYKAQFFTGSSGTNPYGTSLPASTVFLNTSIADRTVRLNWIHNVPWINFEYEIYRKSPGGSAFDLIGTSTTSNFIDKNVENNKQYCYQIKALGTYGIQGISSPLINFSQEVCTIPKDITPPCMPTVRIDRNCATKDVSGNIINKIIWTLKATDTCFIDDVNAINIYFRPNQSGILKKIATITNLSITSFEHTPDSGFTGCYILTATDKNNNESNVLGEQCPAPCALEYELPNAFSPNNDGKNDIYTPLKNSGVIKVKFEIFNRWGEKLFITENPALNWDGKDRNGKDLNDGVYYYTCVLQGFHQNNTTSVEERKGYIQIIH